MNYSVRYLDKGGITERSEFLPFDSDAAANAHSKIGAPHHSIVEVWKGDNLVSRTFRDAKSS